MAADTDTLREASARLDALLGALDGHTDPTVRDGVREAVGLLMDLHREGLARMMAMASDTTLGGAALVGRVADDPLLAPLLLVHRLHPYGLEVRVARALERLRGTAAARGGRVTLAGVGDGSARVTLELGPGDADVSDLCRTIEQRLLEAAPELTAVAVDVVRPQALLQILRQPPPAAVGPPQ